jgi:hypothetical protein
MKLPPDACEWWVFDPTLSREQYVRQALDAYRTTPTTLGRVCRWDHDLAVRLFERRIPFTAVEGALVLAAARRTFLRPPHCNPLAPIRRLSYLLPILHEVLETPIDPAEVSYLWWRMQGRI